MIGQLSASFVLVVHVVSLTPGLCHGVFRDVHRMKAAVYSASETEGADGSDATT